MIENKLVFLDFDGVMTSFYETPGSYVTHGNAGYGPSKSCIDRLLLLSSKTNAKIVISSNWRKFDDDGPYSIWSNAYGDIHNPLPAFKKILGSSYLCDLPKIRHISKANVLKVWMEQNQISEENSNFVIFDDDLREDFQNEKYMNMNKHFILTNTETGLTDIDILKAEKLLA